MKLSRYLLPDAPDVLGLLRRQLAITIAGLDAFAAWAAGDGAKAQAVRDAEDAGDAAKRELLRALRAAFITPLDPEDVFALSGGVDRILKRRNRRHQGIRGHGMPARHGIAEMAARLVEAVRHIDTAIAQLGTKDGEPTDAADAAIESERQLERTYYDGMAALLGVTDMRERISRRELYRRCSGIGETVIDVADRVVYAVVKES